MTTKNNHLKEVMANLHGKIEDKNKQIDNLKVTMSGLEGKIIKKNNGIVKKDKENFAS